MKTGGLTPLGGLDKSLVISSTLVRPVCGGGKLVRSEVGREISQHLAELNFRLLLVGPCPVCNVIHFLRD